LFLIFFSKVSAEYLWAIDWSVEGLILDIFNVYLSSYYSGKVGFEVDVRS
jgi:hypothetical protein